MMSGTDPNQDSAKRSNSRTRTSRPTTPLRPSSRSSFRDSAQRSVEGSEPFPLNTFEPAFAELSDAVADLEANMMHFQLMHESLARFSESFASFLYGLNMNAFCVDFPEVRNCALGVVSTLNTELVTGSHCRVIS
jgi:DASH complex subunit DAM1